MKAITHLQKSLLSYCNVSYDCAYTGRYVPYAAFPKNGDNILPRNVFSHVPLHMAL